MNFRPIRFILGALGFLLFAFPACAQLKITASITVTNKTTNGMVFTLNGDTRTFTNNVANPATMVLTNADTTGAGSKTNLLGQIQTTPFAQVRSVNLGSNSFSLVGNADLPMALTLTAGYAAVSYSTQTVVDVIALQGPISALPTAAARTNAASDIVGAANAVENTNVISQTSTAASQLMGLANSQTVAAIKLFTNAAGQWFGVISNSPAISGTVILLTGGLLTGCTLTNAPSISGNIGRVSGGVWSNGIFVGPIMTNGVNYGDALSSPGSADGSEQFGVSAVATNISATAVGNSSLAGGLASTAVGNGASATGDYSVSIGAGAGGLGVGNESVSIGENASARGNGASALGSEAIANSNNATALGVNAQANFDNSTALGAGAASTSANQVMLGSPGISTVVQNNLTVQTNETVGGSLTVTGGLTVQGPQTNGAHFGTNNFLANSDIAFIRKPYTSIANGNNAGILIGTNIFIEFSGNTAAANYNGFAGGRDGKFFIGLNQTTFPVTIANESGVDPTPGNRIRTLSGADLTIPGTGSFICIYSAAASRWILLSAGTVATVTNVNASQITGSIPATNIYSAITQTNFVLNQLYTNLTGSGLSVHANSSLTTAAVAGSSQIDLMVAQTGSTFSAIDSAKIITSVSAVTGNYLFGLNGSVQTNGIYYFTNSSSGAGDSSSIVSGSGQVTGL